MTINLANQITLYRLLAAPLFMVFFNLAETWTKVVALIILLFAIVTDLLDGYIARKYNIVTTMGKLLDPIADKLIVSTAMIMMIPIGRIPAWIVAIIIAIRLAMGIFHGPEMLTTAPSPQ